jgi:hypothetical protein
METKHEVLYQGFTHLTGEIVILNKILNIIPFYFIQEIKDPDHGLFIPKTIEVEQHITNSTWRNEANKRVYPKLGCFILKNTKDTNILPNSISNITSTLDIVIDDDTNLLFLGAYETFSFHIPFNYKVKTEKKLNSGEYKINNAKEHVLGSYKNDYYSNQYQKSNPINGGPEILEDDIAFENFGAIYNSVGFVFLHPDLKLVLIPIDKNDINDDTLISKKS